MPQLTWKIWVETEGPDGTATREVVASVSRDAPGDPGTLGLQLAEAKDLLHHVQARMIEDQVALASALDKHCPAWGAKRSLHDHRRRAVDTLFGRVAVRTSRWSACCCRAAGDAHAGKPSRTSSLLSARATPELARVQAELGARLSFREAGRVMALLLPVRCAPSHATIRRGVAQTAEEIQAFDDASPHRMSRAAEGP